MRQTAATALLELYSVPENVSPLHTFTERFSTRYAELIYDVDEIVAVKGVCTRSGLPVPCAFACLVPSALLL